MMVPTRISDHADSYECILRYRGGILKIALSLICICILGFGLLQTNIPHLYSHTTATAGCRDIPASPNYLATEHPADAIAAINNAHRIEHLSPLHLLANFYQLDPVQQQFLLLNQERTIRGLTPLTLDANLSQMAQGYSQQLRDLHFFSHSSPIAGTFNTRINSNPLVSRHYSLAAENIAGNPVAGIGPIYEYMYNDVAEACGHRQNILDPQLQLVGIGLVYGSEYGSISAQEFLASAPWNPYPSTHLKNTTPHIAIIATQQKNRSGRSYLTQITGTIGTTRISWFLDNDTTPQHIGPTWSLDLRHLSSGEHTIRAYVVDGEQHYGTGEDVITGNQDVLNEGPTDVE